MKRTLISVALALGALLAAPWAAAEAPDPAPLFAATLPGVDGKPVALSRYAGRPLVVNFWARWCGPCKEEIPALAAAARRYEKRGLTVVGIGIEDDGAKVAEFARAYGIDYPILLAGDDGIPLLRSLGNRSAGLPYTLVIDRNGRVKATKLGILKPADMNSAFEAALAK